MLISPYIRRERTVGRQRGYILLTLMFFVTVLAIAAMAIVPTVTFQIRRDREEELIHRGVQYSRAVRRYYKKFGRFPTRIEELENTNNIRFLRKRYKDPVTGKEFKILHFGDVKLTFGAGIAGANPAGVPTLGGAAMQNMAMQNPALAAAAAGMLANAQGLNAQGTTPNLNAQPADASGQTSTAGGNAAPGNPADATSSTNAGPTASGPGAGFSGPTFGGGPIVGVASTSEKESIREFNKKNHYNQWQFIYDPGSDRGGLLNAPAQPPLQNAVQNLQQPGAQGAPGFGQNMGQPAGQPQQAPPQVQPAPQQ